MPSWRPCISVTHKVPEQKGLSSLPEVDSGALSSSLYQGRAVCEKALFLVHASFQLSVRNGE